MTRINFSENGSTPFEQLIGYNTKILNQWIILEECLWKDISIDAHLLEQVRRTTAFENGCEYCMVKGGKPQFDKSEIKVSLATAFAELFCKDHKSISDKHFQMMREYFSEAEISELCLFIAFTNACQKMGKIFNLTEDYQVNAQIKLSEISKEIR